MPQINVIEATYLLASRCHSISKLFATRCQIWLAWDLNYIPSTLKEMLPTQPSSRVRFWILPLRFEGSIPSAVADFSSACKYLCSKIVLC